MIIQVQAMLLSNIWHDKYIDNGWVLGSTDPV